MGQREEALCLPSRRGSTLRLTTRSFQLGASGGGCATQLTLSRHGGIVARS
jgi:hypothetical protein